MKKKIQKIYTEKIPCAVCGKLIEEYSKDNKSRTIKSWLCICYSCYRKIGKQVTEQEKRITKLEKSVFTHQSIPCWAIVAKESKEKEFDILGFSRLYVYVGQGRGKKQAEKDKKFYKGRKGYNYKIVPIEIKILSK